jgi:hypothetical protein
MRLRNTTTRAGDRQTTSLLIRKDSRNVEGFSYRGAESGETVRGGAVVAVTTPEMRRSEAPKRGPRQTRLIRALRSLQFKPQSEHFRMYLCSLLSPIVHLREQHWNVDRV